MGVTGSLADVIGTIVAAAGTLGTACFGIVEALKWTPLGEAGFGQIKRLLGPQLLGALHVAYGADYEKLLRAQYRQDSSQQTLIAKALRQGVRLGLTADNGAAIAAYIGTVKPADLQTAAAHVAAGTPLSAVDQNAIARFEMAADARIDSALSRAQDKYLGTVRCSASALAVGIAELVVYLSGTQTVGYWGGLLVGIVAVPLAPIANDVVGALQAATKALRSR